MVDVSLILPLLREHQFGALLHHGDTEGTEKVCFPSVHSVSPW